MFGRVSICSVEITGCSRQACTVALPGCHRRGESLAARLVLVAALCKQEADLSPSPPVVLLSASCARPTTVPFSSSSSSALPSCSPSAGTLCRPTEWQARPQGVSSELKMMQRRHTQGGCTGPFLPTFLPPRSLFLVIPVFLPSVFLGKRLSENRELRPHWPCDVFVCYLFCLFLSAWLAGIFRSAGACRRGTADGRSGPFPFPHSTQDTGCYWSLDRAGGRTGIWAEMTAGRSVARPCL